MLSSSVHALSLNDDKISLVELATNQVLATLSSENEDISTFVVSPNELLVAAAYKNGLVRIFKLPDLDLDFVPESFSQMDCHKVFKLTN